MRRENALMVHFEIPNAVLVTQRLRLPGRGLADPARQHPQNILFWTIAIHNKLCYFLKNPLLQRLPRHAP
jgi:hypothetical protein